VRRMGITDVHSRSSALVDFFAVEAPAAGVAGSGKALELVNAAFRIVAAGDGLQIIANHLVEALAQRLGLLACAGCKLIVEGRGDVH
jgi:hypothetical protein